jgi:cholesterol transport system auxiliary component
VTRVAVAESPVAISYVKDAAWVEPPARLFQRLLAETIAAKTGKVVVDPRQLNAAAGAQLTGILQSFGLDAQKQQAVVIYDASISRDLGKKVETRRFEARISVGEIDAVSIGAPLNQAANKVAADVAAWIGQ